MIDLDEIEKRWNEATPKPWRSTCGRTITVIPTRDKDVHVCGVGADTIAANIDLVAAARSDVPALCAEVRRLRLQVRALENAMKEGDEAESSIEELTNLRIAAEAEACYANAQQKRADDLEESVKGLEKQTQKANAQARDLEVKVKELEEQIRAHDRESAVWRRWVTELKDNLRMAQGAEAEARNFRAVWPEALDLAYKLRARAEKAEARVRELEGKETP